MDLFVSGFLLSLSLCLDIGIVNIMIIKTGVEKGFLPSLSVGIGSSFGDLIYAILSVFGITLILKYLFIRWIIWIAGTIVLLYFCYRMAAQIVKSPDHFNRKILRAGQHHKKLNFFMAGFGLALSSPTAIIWFATIGGSIIATQGSAGHSEVTLFLCGFFTAAIVWSTIIAALSHKSGQLMHNRIKRIFSALAAIIFLIFAAYVFYHGYTTLIK